jgi:hypothetical protein
MQHPAYADHERPPFDEAFAQTLVGKTILVGRTIQDKRGEFKGQEQFWGKVESASSGGIVLVLRGSRTGERVTIPPATDWLERVQPGKYTLRSTGETVDDPDFLLTVRLTRAVLAPVRRGNPIRWQAGGDARQEGRIDGGGSRK